MNGKKGKITDTSMATLDQHDLSKALMGWSSRWELFLCSGMPACFAWPIGKGPTRGLVAHVNETKPKQ